MSRQRSPSYPSVSLEEALSRVGQLYDANHLSPIDRDAAAMDLGYNGLTGSSGKMIANLGHYGLIEKTSKGGIKVSQLALDILHEPTVGAREAAIGQAAHKPALFAELQEEFPHRASENALHNYLSKRGFAKVAIPLAIRSYLDTRSFLEKESASKSHDASQENPSESMRSQHSGGAPRPYADLKPAGEPAPPSKSKEVQLMDGERVVFADEAAPAQYLKLVVSGEVDKNLIDALEDYVKRQKKRLGVTDGEAKADHS